MARGQGASGQKASAGSALFREASTGFRRMRRADRGKAGLPYNGITLSLGKEGLARGELAEWRWSLYRVEGLREAIKILVTEVRIFHSAHPRI